ncbi:MAG: hypothetical protein ACFFG0_26740 [Candidatus Thorarchaeota archaeon]
METECIINIANNITKGKDAIKHNGKESELLTQVEKEIDFLFGNTEKVTQILKILFPENIPLTSEFYNKLSNFYNYLGFNSTTYKLIGVLWIEAYKLLEKSDKEKLLTVFVVEKDVEFWDILNSLSTFLGEIELSPDFASKWFYMIGEKIKGDGMRGIFYNSIDDYSFKFPQSALIILEQLIREEFDDIDLEISARILGSVRSSSEVRNIHKEIIKKWDDKLKKDHQTGFRLCYHRSWLTSFQKGTVKRNRLKSLLSKMMEGNQREIDEAFYVMYKCLLSKLNDKPFINFAMSWFKQNASSQIPSLAKYCVTNSVVILSNTSQGKKRLIDLDETNKLIISILPINLDDTGTLKEVERYLVRRLHENKEEFEKLLNQVLEADSEGLLKILENDEFRYLKSEISKTDLSLFVFNLLFSKNDKKREIGFKLFREIKTDSLPDEVLKQIDETQLNIAILEFIQNRFIGQLTSKFLLMFEPAFRNVSPELKEFFKKKMVFQAVNYPGECLEKWEKVSDPSELLKNVISSAKKYFEKLRNIHDSHANSFLFPEFQQAAEKADREFLKKFSESVREKSVFIKFAKNIDMIYGEHFSDNLDSPFPLTEMSQSLEVPRLEIIDPELMMIKRMQARVKIWSFKNKND